MEMLDLVATTIDLPEEGIDKGDEGTIVEILAPGVFLVEFCDDDGVTLSTLVLKAEQLRVV